MFRKGMVSSRRITPKKKKFVDSGAVKRPGPKEHDENRSSVEVTTCATTPEEDAKFLEEKMAYVPEELPPPPVVVEQNGMVSLPLSIRFVTAEELLEMEGLSNIVALPEPEEKEVVSSEDSAYYVVIDFEATCSKSERVPREETEIIEFAAVLVDKRTLSPVSEFNSFVRPVIHPTLDSFCVELTSITQDMIDDAPSFPTVLRMFAGWLAKFQGEKTFCSWGDYDKNQLRMECERNNVEYPFADDHLNLKKMFSRARGTKKGYGVGAALKNLGLEFEGTQHRGIDDARNIARLLTYVIEPS